MPVKDNQKGVDLFLEHFFATHTTTTYPHEIIIVDNNSEPKITLNQRAFPIPIWLFECKKPGPASARNVGALHAKTQWLLFTDSDCIPTANILTGYTNAQNGSIGYAGAVKSFNSDSISSYYEEQEILMPPKVYERANEPRPDYLITANCLIWKPAFELTGGFNEKISIAGGEDIDLGFRLLNIGQLSYAFNSEAYHNFGDGIRGFVTRFNRYGRGNRIINILYNLNLKPKPFLPNKKTPIGFVLATLQFACLAYGYYSHPKQPPLRN